MLSDDILLGFVTTAMAVLGGAASAYPPTTGWRKIACATLFVGLGFLALGLVIKQSKETAKASQNLTNSLNQIQRLEAEAARIQTLNTQLQQQLLSSTQMITRLAKENINTLTGGRSYLYFNPRILGDSPTEIGTPGIPKGSLILDASPRVVGTFPLHDVYVSVFGPRVHVPDVGYGTVYPGEFHTPPQALALAFRPDQPKQFFHIFIYASNGVYNQVIFVENIGGHWVWASRFGRYPQKKATRVWSSSDFPKEQLNCLGKLVTGCGWD